MAPTYELAVLVRFLSGSLNAIAISSKAIVTEVRTSHPIKSPVSSTLTPLPL